MAQTNQPAGNSTLLRQAAWLAGYRFSLRISEQGIVVSVGDGIIWVQGLPSAAIDDVLSLEDGSSALVFDLAPERLGAILLIQTEQLTAGTIAYLGTRQLTIPVGEALLGRVVDPMGRALDNGGPVESGVRRPMEIPSPPIVAREFVHEPLYTGIKSIDTLIPIGKGQRQLIIGDGGIGRSALAIDAVINQRDKNVCCVYVLIGQKRSSVVNTVELLRHHGAMAYTAVVVGEASALPGLKYLAPFAGCAIAEGWMAQGKDVLIVYDDLSTHAQTYRELSLLLRRPPGREAYPGDIFSLHARLLERATCLNHRHGGGSLTALPIIETKQGEIAAYIPTNLISITDGQLYLDQQLFSSGFRPAIDIARSVSRIGGKAQHPRIKEEAGRMKLDYLQYLELEIFSRFGSKLEASMEAKIKRGRILRELLKQERLTPVSVVLLLAWLIAFNEGMFNHLEPSEVPNALKGLQAGMAATALTLEVDRILWEKEVAACLGREDVKRGGS
jgi:F-type H+-transporting ATPase subunit alpha